MLTGYLTTSYTVLCDLVRKVSIKGWTVWRPVVNPQRSSSTNLEHKTPTVVADGNGGVVIWEEENIKL
jgi:hypothetical protein